MHFVETDNLIVNKAGKSIPEIFREDGEIDFREIEIEAVKDAARGIGQIIACGGGVVLNTINIARLKQTGIVVLLTASVDEIIKRTSPDRETRPMLASAEDHTRRVTELLKFRRPFYQRAADIRVNTTGFTISEVADRLINRIRRYEGIDISK